VARDLTIVFVTHDLEEAQLLGDRLVVLNGPLSQVETVERADGTFNRTDLLRHLTPVGADTPSFRHPPL
jgi:ABC-type nitrate/sulfonate/bicarbonate transport system ATPase subunit